MRRVRVGCSTQRWLVAALLVLWFPCFVGASGNWSDYRQSGRFHIRAEVRVDQTPDLQRFIASLADHEADVISTLQLSRNDRPILINVFESRRSYLEFISKQAPEGKRRRALFVQSEDHGSVYAYVHSDMLTDLRHETTHAILHSSLPFLPLWLDEGLAEYFEVPAQQRASNHPHQGRVKLAARFRLTWRPSLVRLEAKRDLSGLGARDYRESWAWLHFLLHGPGEAKDVLLQYLASIEAHTPPGPFSKHLRNVWPDPERELTAHLRSWK